MEDERLDELIRSTLIESQQVPEPPLDEMWAQIELRAFDIARRPMPTPWIRWATPAIAAAAALIIGVGVGYSVAPRGSVVTTVIGSPSQYVADNATTGAPDVSTSHETNDTPTNPTRIASTAGANHTTRAQSVRTRPPSATVAFDAPDVSDISPVRLASHPDVAVGSDMSRYLARTAALLGSLPSDHTTAQSDTTIANVAGDLLTQTHLLLDSKAGSDPTLHKLLEDLELVLAQVARLRVQRSTSDLQLIHQALAVHDVLPRVHDATVEASITE
jgi:hypothetical protein